MRLTEEILQKLNDRKKTGDNLMSVADPEITLPDIMVRSFAEVKDLAGDSLSWGEKNFLYQQAQQELKENKLAESRILSRANPQLANAVRLGIRQSTMLDSYNDLFPQRADKFVKPGSVASMFSPAGYLTELYREARDLHPDTSQYHLDTRRPDLASLSLSQSNMDDELSTLSLSNELLLNTIQTQQDMTYEDVLEMLSTYRLTGVTPYSQPYEATRQALLLQDPEFTAFRRNPEVAAKMDISALLGIEADISPELRAILAEEITEENADELVTKNFGEMNIEIFKNSVFIARWYGLTNDELASILKMETISDLADENVQHYQSDQLVLRGGDDDYEVLVFTRKYPYGWNSSRYDYFELIPTGAENSYLLNYRLNTISEDLISQVEFISAGSGGDTSDHDNFIKITDSAEIARLLRPGGGHSIPVTFDNSMESLREGVPIGMVIQTPSARIQSTFIFKMQEYGFNIFLLKINKLIRLYKASGIPPSDILAVIESSNNDLTITADVLSQLFWVRYYMRRYGIDVNRALVLSGATISQISHNNTPSFFTRLFNTPLLNGQELFADGTSVNLLPGESADTFRLAALKRAMQVNNTELNTLWCLAKGEAEPGDYACTIDNLTTLYRISLLAGTHGLSITELAALLSVSPFADQAIESLSAENLAQLISFLDQYTGWLKEQNWTVSDLYLMLTDSFSTTLSPEIDNLIATLRNGVANQDVSGEDDASLINAVAPFIAAATQLDSAETAAAVLQWQDQLKPQGLAVKDFVALVNNDNRTAEETTKLVSYCQVLGQLTLIVRNIGLSAMELSWVVTRPASMTYNATELPHDIATLYSLTELHKLLARCGTYASEILTSLSGVTDNEKNNLAIATVATALNLDEQALGQALEQISSYEAFYNWN